MPLRILLQLAIVGLPFAMFGIYLMLSTAAEEDGRRKWPFAALFGIGIVLSAAVWFFMILREDRNPNKCITPPRYENGELIPAQERPCDQVVGSGVPVKDDPGSAATGVEYEEELRDTRDIGARAPGQTKPKPDDEN